MTVRKSLEKYTVSELKEKAKSKKITGYSKMLKAELIAAIRAVHAKRVAKKGTKSMKGGEVEDFCGDLNECNEKATSCTVDDDDENLFCGPLIKVGAGKKKKTIKGKKGGAKHNCIFGQDHCNKNPNFAINCDSSQGAGFIKCCRSPNFCN
jgi:hypothetical protein